MGDEQTPARSGEHTPPEDLTVLYCGGCNPHIDRAAVAAEVRGSEDAPSTGTLYLSGCPRACASDHRLIVDGRAAVVAGANVNGVPTEPRDLASVVRAKLKE
jgi:hypothetical protein